MTSILLYQFNGFKQICLFNHGFLQINSSYFHKPTIKQPNSLINKVVQKNFLSKSKLRIIDFRNDHRAAVRSDVYLSTSSIPALMINPCLSIHPFVLLKEFVSEILLANFHIRYLIAPLLLIMKHWSFLVRPFSLLYALCKLASLINTRLCLTLVKAFGL